MESPSNAQAPTFYFNEAVIARQKDKFFFIHLASNNLSPIWRYPKNWSLFTGKKICSMDSVIYLLNNRGLGSISAFTCVL